jgi:hypothetical protein
MGWMFGAGWHRPERVDAGALRWTAAPDAYLVLPVVDDGPWRISIVAQPAGDEDDGVRSMGLAINGRDMGPCELRGGWQTCVWDVPAEVLTVGGNSVVVRSPRTIVQTNSPDGRSIGVALAQIVIGRTPA